MLEAQMAKRKPGDEQHDLFLNIHEREEPFTMRDLFENSKWYKNILLVKIASTFFDSCFFCLKTTHSSTYE